MIDDIVAWWFRATDWSRATSWGRALERWFARFRPAPPISDGYYLANATRFEIGRMRNQLLAYDRYIPRSLRQILVRWFYFHGSYLIMKHAEGGRCVDPFVGSAMMMTLPDDIGQAIIAGTRNMTSVKTQELRRPPVNYVYGQFAEADDRHRAVLMRLLIHKVVTELGAPGVTFIARPVTEAALHFYRSRGFVRTDGSSPELNHICYSQLSTNPRFARILRTLDDPR